MCNVIEIQGARDVGEKGGRIFTSKLVQRAQSASDYNPDFHDVETKATCFAQRRGLHEFDSQLEATHS